MVPLSQFYPKLMPLVIGCPQPLANQALVDSAIEFCESSLTITETLDPVATVSGRDTYDVNLPGQMAVATVLRAWYNDRPLTPAATHSVAAVDGRAGSPQYFYGWDTDEGFAIRLYPVPDEVGSLVIRAGLKPIRTATQIHSALYNDWYDAIVDGAVAFIKAIPDQAYTDYEQAGMRAGAFRAVAARARLSGIYGKAQANLSVQMRRF